MIDLPKVLWEKTTPKMVTFLSLYKDVEEMTDRMYQMRKELTREELDIINEIIHIQIKDNTAEG
jgi:hypothetical protein